MKGFINQFEDKVKSTIRKYTLIDKNDRIIVACSGGKDSTTTLYLLNKFGYHVEALIIDLLIGNWSKKNLENIKQFCKDHRIKLRVVNMRKEFGCSICYIRSGIQSKTKLKNCMICGVIKRWLLNKKARELGATKLATGHNLDDEAETILMNLFKGNPKLSLGLGPKIGIISDKKFVTRIKPLYFCTNEELKSYSRLMNFPVLYDPCPCSIGAFRGEIRKGLARLEKQNLEIKTNIVKNFLKLISILKENYKLNEKLKYCNNCGEPTRNDVCKTCELIKILRC
ncbi:MAG: TIGR00269 family protein [Nanoarchaeota archaeon]|nr:TIGR00269 family protein [Nanoarchaeota archaeon]